MRKRGHYKSIFSIACFPGGEKFVLSGDPLYNNFTACLVKTKTNLPQFLTLLTTKKGTIKAQNNKLTVKLVHNFLITNLSF